MVSREVGEAGQEPEEGGAAGAMPGRLASAAFLAAGRGSSAGLELTSKSWGTTLNRTGRLHPRTSWAASWMGCEKLRPIHSLMKSLGTAISRPSCFRSSRVELLNHTWNRCCPTRWAMASARRTNCGSCALMQLTSISLRSIRLLRSAAFPGPSEISRGHATPFESSAPEKQPDRAGSTRPRGAALQDSHEASCL